MSTTVDELTDQLRTSILRGELQPGQRLRQDHLAARFGISKIPLREALQRLASEGLTEFTSNRGSSVRRLTPATAAEVYGLRRALEPALLSRSIPRSTIVDLAEAELALTTPGLSTSEANWRFHHALYRASGWEHGLGIVASLFAVVAPYVALYTDHLDQTDRSDHEHQELLDACRIRDLDTALTVLIRHLDGAAAALTAHLEAPSPE